MTHSTIPELPEKDLLKHKAPGGADRYALPDLSRCLIRAAAKLNLSGDAAVIRESWLDPNRFAVLFDTHFAEIYRYMVRRLGRGAADHLTAEVFLVAFGQRYRYDLSQMSARPWLYGIATRLVGRYRPHEVARYRALARRAAVGHYPTSSEVAVGGQRTWVARALATLRAGDRDVLLTAALTGLSDDEIALALGITRPVMRSRLCHARGILRAAAVRQVTAPAGQGPVNDELLLVRAALPEPAAGPAPWVVADAWALLKAPRPHTAGAWRLRAGGPVATAREAVRLFIPPR